MDSMAQRSCKVLESKLSKMNKALDKIELRVGTRKENKRDVKAFNRTFKASMKIFDQLQKCSS